jgi:hypothetical protein
LECSCPLPLSLCASPSSRRDPKAPEGRRIRRRWRAHPRASSDDQKRDDPGRSVWTHVTAGCWEKAGYDLAQRALTLPGPALPGSERQEEQGKERR